VPTLLAFIPHPDDESYSFAGTVALAARAGWACFVHCASSGEGGERHDGGRPGKDVLAVAREGELAESCRIIGADPPVFWRLPDGSLAGRASQADRVARAISICQADLVLSLDRDGAYGHPDHVALAAWVMAGWKLLAEPRPPLLLAAFPPGLFVAQWEKCHSMMGNPPSPLAADLGVARSHYSVDIRPVRELKLRSISAHRTQLPGGDPEALFPPGIVADLLDVERFTDARGSFDPVVERLMDDVRRAGAGEHLGAPPAS
jgi:LmbE family N-acetylglucosaminyl deacetylase